MGARHAGDTGRNRSSWANPTVH